MPKMRYDPMIRSRNILYENRAARDSPEVAHALKTAETHLKMLGDRATFAWASTHAVIVDSAKGVRLILGTAEAACKIEAALIATREQMESIINKP